MPNRKSEESDTEAREIVCVAGGAALILMGAGLAMAHPVIRRNVKSIVAGLMPEFQAPLKAGIRNVLPDIERYMKLKGM
jgi:hypothetical protein